MLSRQTLGKCPAGVEAVLQVGFFLELRESELVSSSCRAPLESNSDACLLLCASRLV